MTRPAYERTIGKGVFSIVQGDLTRAETRAVVNAANSSLAGGGGVDGAIHRAAGPELLKACLDIVAKQGRLPAGQAVITPGFNLRADYVIHTVGPVWRGGNNNEERLLRSAYRESLNLAAENNIASIAFPAVSCGVYGYPLERAVPTALRTIAQALTSGLVGDARMYVYSEKGLAAWMQGAKDMLEP